MTPRAAAAVAAARAFPAPCLPPSVGVMPADRPPRPPASYSPPTLNTAAARPARRGRPPHLPLLRRQGVPAEAAAGRGRAARRGGGRRPVGGDGRGGGSHLHCGGCTADYVRADRDVETIAAGLRVDPRVPLQVRHYYGEGPTVSGLLRCRLAAMARRVHARRSPASARADRAELLPCFSYRGVRTFGPLVRRRGKGGYHYAPRGPSRA